MPAPDPQVPPAPTRERMPQDDVLHLPDRTRLLGPPAILLALLASALLTVGERTPELLGWLAVYVVPPAGKESVIPALLARGFDPFLVFTYILGLDILVGLFVLWNYDRLLALPHVGDLLKWIRNRWDASLEEKPWLANLTFTGVVLFIAVPLQGSGGLAGALLGRTLGMRTYRVLVAVTLGSALAVLAVVNLSTALLAALQVGWGWAIMVLVGAGMVAYSLASKWRRWQQGQPA